VEHTLAETISLRAGFRDDGDDSHFSLGGGLNFSNITVDYAFMPRDELGDVQRLSLGFVF
jgi:hypothetical protein